MRSRNPILSRPDSFTSSYQPTPGGYQPSAYQQSPGQYQAGPYQQQPGAYPPPGHGPQPGYGQNFEHAPNAPGQPFGAPSAPPAAAGVMTMDDVIVKTTMLMLALVAGAAVSWLLVPPTMLSMVAIVGFIVAAITVWVVALRKTLPIAGIWAYALIEGLALGALSRLFEFLYPGIVMQAVLGTIVAAFTLLAAYKFLNVRVRGRFAQVVTVSVIAYGVLALLSLGMALMGMPLGLFASGPSAGPLAWIFSAIGIVLAAACLLMDFDAIEQGVRNGAPESESWRGAFGLIVTLAWMYVQILRILSYFRN